MSEPMGTPRSAGGRATTALVLGIVGVICCTPLAPVAWYLGNAELAAIRAGTAPAAGEGSAKAGKVLGMIGTVLLILLAIWIAVVGVGTAMAVFQGIAEQAR
jgi:hypothetical protein